MEYQSPSAAGTQLPRLLMLQVRAGNKSTCCLVTAVQAQCVFAPFIACLQCFVRQLTSSTFFFQAVGAAPSKTKANKCKSKAKQSQTELSKALGCLHLPTAPPMQPRSGSFKPSPECCKGHFLSILWRIRAHRGDWDQLQPQSNEKEKTEIDLRAKAQSRSKAQSVAAQHSLQQGQELLGRQRESRALLHLVFNGEAARGGTDCYGTQVAAAGCSTAVGAECCMWTSSFHLSI